MIKKRGTDEELENLCPACGEPPQGVCRCPTSHSFCKNGHNWYLKGFTRKELKEDGRVHVVESWYDWVLE